MQEFLTAIEDVVEEEKSIKFKVDGRELTAYEPSDGQLAMLMATFGRGSSEADKIAGAINFFVAVLSEPDAAYIEGHLLDRHERGRFGIANVEEIMEWLIEQWSGRPSESLSVSTSSPESTGQSSTPPTPESTSSAFGLTDS